VEEEGGRGAKLRKLDGGGGLGGGGAEGMEGAQGIRERWRWWWLWGGHARNDMSRDVNGKQIGDSYMGG
jgi:hypothetical protein